MSQDIISTKFNDPNIQQVRQATGRHSDQFPFLLMPVRLETRFMKVDRPVSLNFDPDVLHLLVELKYLFLKLEHVELDDLPEARDLRRQLEKVISDLDRRMVDPMPLPYPENTRWEENVADIRESYDRLIVKFEGLSHELQQHLANVRRALENAVLKIENYRIAKAKETEYDEGKQLVGKLNYIEDVLQRISDKPVKYTSKTKHHYFNYIDKQFEKIDKTLVDVEEKAMKNVIANPNQISRISEMPVVYHRALTKVRKKLSRIRSDYKRNEFLTRYHSFILPGMRNISTMIEEVIVPKLNYVYELKRVNGTELVYQAKMIKFELELINKKGFKNYGELKETRVHLYHLLRKFREAGHDIITGSPEIIHQLRSTWSEVDVLLEEYTWQVSRLKPTNRYEKAGITRSISHINENYRADLEGLKLEAPENRAFIKNSNFIESANAYNIAIRKLDELTEHIRTLAYADTVHKRALGIAVSRVQDFKDEFAALVTKTTIIPERFFKDLHYRLNGLNTFFTRIEKKAKSNRRLASLIEEMKQAKKAINDIAGTLESDITDEYDAFYDDFRKKFIFEMPSETVDELWVRIYPDDIFINSHEEAITREELDDTRYFWTEVWNAANDEETELAAWRPLALKYGENRAVYLRDLLTPERTGRGHRKPSRPLIEIKNKLKEVNSIIDEINAQNRSNFSFLPVNLNNLHFELNACVILADHFQKETAGMLNTVAGLLDQVGQKLNALKQTFNKLSGLQLTSQDISNFDDAVNAAVTLVGKLEEVKAVKDITLLESTVFPEFPDDYRLKEESWSGAPRSEVMPDRFVFLGMKDGEFTHTKVGNAIPDPLIVGIDPSSNTEGLFEYDDKGNLKMDENTKWLTDFDEAVKKGMGITVPLRPDERENGFDKIIVIGVKHTGAEEAKIMLEKLLRSHAYLPEGIDLLSIGTATNNTEKKVSGFSSQDEIDDTYRRITGSPVFTEYSAGRQNIDGYRIMEALGVDDSVFNRLKNADGRDIYNALLMNKSMWNSTMGYYLEEVLDTVFNLDNNRRTREYFTKYVTGRGWLPALRIGNQPYGILPTTAFSRFKAYRNEQLPPLDKDDIKYYSSSYSDNILQQRFDIRLNHLLSVLRRQWTDIVKREKLKIDDFDPEQKSAQEHFIQLLGLQATSIEQYYRYNTNVAQRRSIKPSIGEDFTVNFSKDSMYGPANMKTLFGQLLDEGYFIDDTYFDMKHIERIGEARIFRLRYHNEFGQLLGPFVRENDDDFLPSVNGNTYINKLLSVPLDHLWNDDAYDDLKSNSLFFMFLRQSLALAYRDVALDILMEERIINENTRRRAGSKGTYLIPGPDGNDVIFTKWDYLFRRLSDLENMMSDGIRVFEHFPLAGEGVWEHNKLWKHIKSHNWSMGDYLYQLREDDLNVVKVTQLKNQFLELNELPVSVLERLFAEHLDLCTYRFDAWQLGLANKRLDKMRKGTAPKGIYLGAFGLLEDLKPGGERKPAVDLPDRLKENDNKIVYTDEDNEGFIHTPSINHAMTAAILRGGYMANRGAGDMNNAMAVNLTSKRVRMALKLIGGIRNGQETGALLGYQFERGLHENYLAQGIELDKYIYDLRRKFPLVPDVDSGTAINQNEEKNLMHVVNGLELLESVRELLGEEALRSADSFYELERSNMSQLKSDLFPNTNITNIQFEAILKEIDEMANAFDAMGDLLLSESVYHIVQGNHVRSAAVFAALSEGRVPQEVQIVNTPRTGHVLTQRMVLQLETVSSSLLESDPSAAISQHWGNVALTPRAFAEPSLNKWLGNIIGDPSLIRCYVTYMQDDAEHSYIVRLSDLGLQPIDALYVLNSTEKDNDDSLNKLIAYQVRSSQSVPVDITLNIHFKDRNEHLVENSETLTPDIKTFNEVMPLFNGLYETITRSRHTTAEDYVIPGSNVPDDLNLQQLDIDELMLRTNIAYSKFSGIRDDIQSVFDGKGINVNDVNEVKEAVYTEDEINTLNDKLLEAFYFGIQGTVPDDPGSGNGKTLAVQAVGVLKEMIVKANKADAFIGYDDRLEDMTKVNSLKDAAGELFGKDFVVVPHFTLRNREELAEILGLGREQGLLRNADEFAMDAWAESIAKVRERVNKVEMVSTMTRLFDNHFPEYTPVQLPYETVKTVDGGEVADYWLGLEYPQEYEPESDKLSLVVLNKDQLIAGSSGSRTCGLLIDEWIEVIPQKEETTGVTFNYDQPDAEPPQSMLLAVPPEETGWWKWDDLAYTILDTMDLYKARLVEPEHIDKSIFTQVLPAVLGEYPVVNEYRDELAKLGMFDLAENNTENND